MSGKVAKPHMVVGVDLGMTCTGVAYANLSIGSSTIRWVQKWPGRYQANENKVPTVIIYQRPPALPTRPKTDSPQSPHAEPNGDASHASPGPGPSGDSAQDGQIPQKDQPMHPSSWGFSTENTSESAGDDKEYREWFKTMLDPARLAQAQEDDPEEAPKSMQDVEQWYEDYLGKMYEYLAFKLSSEISGATWETAIIEFIFSVPTTWPAYPTVERFKHIVQRAGFGSVPSHSVTIGLTEAEAAAVHVSTEAPGIFREGDILLVCDAGGGTTDLSVLRVVSTVNQAITLQQLDVVFGETIGSAAIDYEFQKLVEERLEKALERTPELAIDPPEDAWDMKKSRDFQAVKCEYGAPDDTPLFSVAIPNVSHSYNDADPEVRIKGGELQFRREELQALFDRQISKLCRLIDLQLAKLEQKHPGEQVAHMVLSGGLGNSAYVQYRLRAHYASSQLPNAQDITVRVAPDPQLAVCKGIVSDRVRKLLSSHSVLGWRCCRASYGTMCKIQYDKKNPEHAGKQLIRDPMNGKMYITQAVAWFVKKGEPVSVDEPIVHDFVKKIRPGDPRTAFPTTVIESSLEGAKLPYQMNHETRILCEIHSDLSSADEKRFIEKNKRFWSLGKHYLRVEYQVKVLIGPADVRFELWFDGQKLSKDQPIKVEWTPVPTPDMAIFNRVELPVTRPAGLANPLASPVGKSDGGSAAGEEKKRKKGWGR